MGCGASRERTYRLEAAAAASFAQVWSGACAPASSAQQRSVHGAIFRERLPTDPSRRLGVARGSRRLTVPGQFICCTRRAPPAVRQLDCETRPTVLRPDRLVERHTTRNMPTLSPVTLHIQSLRILGGWGRGHPWPASHLSRIRRSRLVGRPAPRSRAATGTEEVGGGAGVRSR